MIKVFYQKRRQNPQITVNQSLFLILVSYFLELTYRLFPLSVLFSLYPPQLLFSPPPPDMFIYNNGSYANKRLASCAPRSCRSLFRDIRRFKASESRGCAALQIPPRSWRGMGNKALPSGGPGGRGGLCESLCSGYFL